MAGLVQESGVERKPPQSRAAILRHRHGDPPKIPATSHVPAATLWLAVLGIAGIAAALLLPPLTTSRSEPEPEVALTAENARDMCLCLSENPLQYLSSEEWQRRNEKRTMEAAELDEPGALAALIELKLSGNAQFPDPAGACKLMETAVARGDQAMARRLAGFRGS